VATALGIAQLAFVVGDLPVRNTWAFSSVHRCADCVKDVGQGLPMLGVWFRSQ
jgi:hypothetical protein